MSISLLIENLKQLEEPHRNADLTIAQEIGYTIGEDSRWYTPAGHRITRVPFFTKKVDEAIILSEIVMGESVCALVKDKAVWRAQAEGGPVVYGKTPAIALCIAVLETLRIK